MSARKKEVTVARDSHELADVLREQPPVLDDVARARLEKAILQAPRVSAPVKPRARRPFVAGVSAGLAVAALALLGWFAFAPTPTEPEVATFEAFTSTREGERPLREGAFVEGEVVTTDVDQHVRAHFAERRVEVEVAPSSRARFLRLGGSDLAVGLDRGSVRVSFHPERRGERSLAIETPLARVEVVGTVFEVDVDADGTRVRVEEGIVRVVPREGDERFVHAGESVRVRQTRTVLAGASDEPNAANDSVNVDDSPSNDGVSNAANDGASVDPDSVDVVPNDPSTARPEGDSSSGPLRTVVETWDEGSAQQRRAIDESAIVVEASRGAEGREQLGANEQGANEPGANESGDAEGGESEVLATAPTSTEAASELAAPRGRPGRALPEDARFELAMRHLDADRFDAARHELRAIARTSSVRSHRARAWADIALTYARQGDARQATEAYRRAAQIGRGTEAGANALFALGQMRLRLGEDELARAAFREYLNAAPEGPLADRARRTLCQRLREWEECGE
jgi:ferric-dicitrate binding protein FerR (iron transport regulator)/TolA-binding protein